MTGTQNQTPLGGGGLNKPWESGSNSLSASGQVNDGGAFGQGGFMRSSNPSFTPAAFDNYG